MAEKDTRKQPPAPAPKASDGSTLTPGGPSKIPARGPVRESGGKLVRDVLDSEGKVFDIEYMGEADCGATVGSGSCRGLEPRPCFLISSDGTRAVRIADIEALSIGGRFVYAHTHTAGPQPQRIPVFDGGEGDSGPLVIAALGSIARQIDPTSVYVITPPTPGPDPSVSPAESAR